MIDWTGLSLWLEREERAEEVLCPTLTARLAALLDRAQRRWAPGDLIPAHWYVQLFGALALQSTLAPDGHPPKGELLPPIPWPRRMFAGRRVSFPGELRIGDIVDRVSRVVSITPKTGRSGPLCFVTLRHKLHTARGCSVIEEQDVVYRPAAQDPAPGPQSRREPETPPAVSATRTLTPDTGCCSATPR